MVQFSLLQAELAIEDVCGVYVPCIYRMPGGVITGDLGLCCCVPVQCVMTIVRAQLLPIVC